MNQIKNSHYVTRTPLHVTIHYKITFGLDLRRAAHDLKVHKFKSYYPWDVTQCSLEDITVILEIFYSEGAGNWFVRNISERHEIA
jgi:hypothetical protein